MAIHHMRICRWLIWASLAVLAGSLLGCSASYVTPGAAVNLHEIRDAEIHEAFTRRPATPFPARIAVVRIQASGYYSQTARAIGDGKYGVVTTREIETDEQFDKLSALPKVAGIARLNHLLVPSRLNSVKDLRASCAALHADMLLVYTLDTQFHLSGQSLGPLTTITLGMLPSKKAEDTTTASAVLYDVRTGYIYGIAEATARSSHLTSYWTRDTVVDNARLETEKDAFAQLVDEFTKTWAAVLTEYADEPSSAPSQ